MKKLFVLALALLAALALTACTPDEPHVHTFATEWSTDADSHWLAATCGDTDETASKASHTFTANGTCEVCGYQGTVNAGGLVDADSFAQMLQDFDTENMTLVFYTRTTPARYVHVQGGLLAQDSGDSYIQLLAGSAFRYATESGVWVRTRLDTQYDTMSDYVCEEIFHFKNVLDACEWSYEDFSFQKRSDGIIEATLALDIGDGEDPTGALSEIRLVIADGRVSSIAATRYGTEEIVSLQPLHEQLIVPHVPSVGLAFERMDGAEPAYAVTGIGTCTDPFIVIPTSYLGFSVKAIAPEAFRGEAITELMIPAGVTDIGESAFEDCAQLHYVELGNSVVSIGARAFALIEDRAEIHFTDSVRSIGAGAFDSDTSYADKGKWYFTGDVNSYATIAFGDVDSTPNLNHLMYVNGKRPAEIVIDTATRINDYAFSNMDGIAVYRIGAQVTYLGHQSVTAGHWNETWTSLLPFDIYYGGTLAQYLSITFGGHWASEDAGYSLCCADGLVEEVSFPAGTVAIPDGIFGNCHSVRRVTIPDGVSAIGDYAFYGTRLDTISVPSSVEAVGWMAFTTDFADEQSRAAFTLCDGLYYVGNSQNPYLVLIGYDPDTLTAVNIHSDTKIIAPEALDGVEGILAPSGE